jgi:lactoylglutathione lyase
MKRAALLGLAAYLAAQTVPHRPRILGIAHLSLYASDIAKARTFYKDFLGFDEPFSLKRDDGSESMVFIKINEDQYLELTPGPPARGDGQLNHYSFYTDDARALREYLGSRGVKVPADVTRGRTGNLNFNVNDPDGHQVEMFQYEPTSWHRREKGKFATDRRISTRMMHIGFVVGPFGRASNFYHDILGFQETWRGGRDGQPLSWVNLRVPDGTDYIEFMLYPEPPPSDRRGTPNHLCLAVPDMDKAVAEIKRRATRVGYESIDIHTGTNGKRQCNLYDPDGTRVELMEPHTVDGKPSVWSTAAPPVP